MNSPFDDFCTRLCALGQLARPALVPDANGLRAFTLTHRGEKISFIERKHKGTDRISMLVRFGPPPLDRADEALANLMRANYFMLDVGNSFVQHPDTQEVFLHTLSWLDRVDAQAIHDHLDRFADAIQQWRRHAFLEPQQRVVFDVLGLAGLV